MPLLRKRGELRLNASSSGGSDVSAIEVQEAYAVTNKVGVMMNTLFATSAANSGSHGSFVEGAAGYFRPIRNRLSFESYAGAGVGTVYNSYGNGSYSDLRFSRLFVQPDFGFSAKYFDAAVSNRFSILNYRQINTVFSQPGLRSEPVDYIRDHLGRSWR